MIGGLLLSGAPAWGTMLAALTVPALGLLIRDSRLAIAAASLVLVGAWLGGARREAIDGTLLGAHLGHTVEARGYLVKRERPTRSGRRARVRLTQLSSGPSSARRIPIDEVVQIVVAKEIRYPPLSIGEEIALTGVLERPAGQTDDRFDYAEYLRRAGVHAVLRADSVRRAGLRRGGPAGLVDRLRERSEAGVGAGLDPRLAALARGIVLGQDERIPRSMVESFKASGLAHLLAVSGQNVTLLAVLALPLLGALGLGRRGRLVTVLGLILVYVPLTGAGPSVLRAGAMGGAGVVAALAGRPGSRWYAFLLAVVFTLVLDPRAWLDAGWQLSFAAVVGIFGLVPHLRRRLHRLPAAIADAIAITLAATLATGPLIAFHFGRVSVVSLFANLIALPVVAPIMWIGMLAASVATIAIEPAALLNGLNGYCLAYLAAVADWTATLPGAVLSLEIRSVAGLVSAYGAPVLAVIAFVRLRHRRRTRRVVVAAAAAMLALAVAAWVLRSPPGPPARFTASFLDVGQGDAILIQAPGDVAVLVDGGPPEAQIVEKLRTAGARALDLVVLTHAQRDHQGGLETVLRELPVSALLDGGSGAFDRSHHRIVTLAGRRGTRVLTPRGGQTLRIGELRLRVLSPVSSPRDSDPIEDPNDRAIVLLVSYGTLDLLLPADAESNVTLGLALPRVEVLKVAHHGSADEGLPSLLEEVRPHVAVIEVGAHNPHGHPSRETLAALEEAVPRVFRTDEDGDVRISPGPHGPVVTTGG